MPAASPDIDLNRLNDVDALRQLVRTQLQRIAEHDTLVAERDRLIVYKDAKIATLTHEIARLKR